MCNIVSVYGGYCLMIVKSIKIEGGRRETFVPGFVVIRYDNAD